MTVNVAGEAVQIRLPKLIADLTQIITGLRAWITNLPPQPPPVILNDHCPICPFRSSCLEQAEKDDSLTLLDRMTPKIMAKYNRKGIFSITQLSFLHKPRRKRPQRFGRPATFSLELQALALRTKTIYVHESPSIPDSATELFLDIEGVPDHGLDYLIGLVVSTPNGIERYSLWADKALDEPGVFEKLREIVERYPNAPIYH